MFPQIRASVVVASRNRPQQLKECLKFILETLTADDEIIVVDSASASSDEIVDIALTAGARLLRTEMGGSARARNLGIQHARGGFVAFTDDDARVESGWLNAIVSRFTDPAVAAVVGPVFELDSAPPKLLISFAHFDAAHDVVSFSRANPDWFARVRVGAIGSGANLAVRRSVFERHGFFPESLGRGVPIPGDENYYLLKLVEGGETVMNEPTARVHHPQHSPARHQELRRRGIVYIAYVLLTRPQLRWPLLKRLLLRKFYEKRSSGPKMKIPFADLAIGLILTPSLLLSARRIDRASDSARDINKPIISNARCPSRPGCAPD